MSIVFYLFFGSWLPHSWHSILPIDQNISFTVFFCLDLTLELFNKCRLRKEILPLASQQDFILLYNGALEHVSSNRSNSSELYLKTTNKSHRTRPRRRCKTGRESTKGTVTTRDNPLTEITATVTLPLHKNPVGKCSKAVSSKTTTPRIRLKSSYCNAVEGHLKPREDGKQAKT